MKVRKLIVALSAAGAVTAVSSPVSADVFVFAEIFKTKDKTVVETIDKVKNVDVDVVFDEDMGSAAESEAIANVRNQNNVVDDARDTGTGPEGPAFGLDLRADLTDSVHDNTGIAHLNQDAGNMVNQGNLLSLSEVGTPEDGVDDPAFTHAQSSMEQINTNNRVRWIEDIEFEGDGLPGRGDLAADKVASIANSINNNSGIVGVNQNVGNMNNQTSSVAVSIGFDSRLALAESDLGQENAGNVVTEVETVRRNVISDSISGNQGIVTVNQSSGNMNNQGTAFSAAALTSSAAISTPGGV